MAIHPAVQTCGNLLAVLVFVHNFLKYDQILSQQLSQCSDQILMNFAFLKLGNIIPFYLFTSPTKRLATIFVPLSLHACTLICADHFSPPLPYMYIKLATDYPFPMHIQQPIC